MPGCPRGRRRLDELPWRLFDHRRAGGVELRHRLGCAGACQAHGVGVMGALSIPSVVTPRVVIPAKAGIHARCGAHANQLDYACDTVPRQRGCGSRRMRPRDDAASRRRCGPSRTHRSGHRVGAAFRGNDESMVGSFPRSRTKRYVKTTTNFLPPEAHPRLFRRLRPALSIPQGQSMSQEQSEYCKVPRFSTTAAAAPRQAVAA